MYPIRITIIAIATFAVIGAIVASATMVLTILPKILGFACESQYARHIITGITLHMPTSAVICTANVYAKSLDYGELDDNGIIGMIGDIASSTLAVVIAMLVWYSLTTMHTLARIYYAIITRFTIDDAPRASLREILAGDYFDRIKSIDAFGARYVSAASVAAFMCGAFVLHPMAQIATQALYIMVPIVYCLARGAAPREMDAVELV